MPYLIDGHNLIGQVQGVSLGDPDDEAWLIEQLRAFCLRTGKQATVYFDRGAPGEQDPPAQSGLTVRFVRPPRTADAAIRAHLAQLRGAARNWTVVSSDRAVQQAARSAGARPLDSRAFAGELGRPSRDRAGDAEKPEAGLSDEELAYWEARFKRRPGSETANS